MAENGSRGLFLEDLAPWNHNGNAVWLASKLQLDRNIEKFNFPAKLPLEKRKQIVNLVMNQTSLIKEFDHPILIKSEECNPLDKEFLVEHCLTEEDFTQAFQGEAFLFDKHGISLVTLNLDDHLHFHYIDIQGELEKGWNKLVTLERNVGESLAFSYSSKFGFLTSSLFNCGTGLKVSLFLQLSGLIHKNLLQSTLEKLADDSVYLTGLMGNATELVGDLAVLKNNFTLGVNEETILTSMRTAATKILVEETAARREIKQSDSPEIKDKVSRAYALLMHSYQIETIEALNEIALLKLGLEMGWIQGITMVDLNKLFFSCRRGHLLRQLPEKIAMEAVAHKRAEFIHQALKNVELLI